MARRKGSRGMGIQRFRAGEVQLPAARGGETFRQGLRGGRSKRGRSRSRY